jgi:hypothetical protein
VGSYAFVNPVIALALGWAVGDGELSARVVVAAAVVVSAVTLTWVPDASSVVRYPLRRSLAALGMK